MRNDCLNALKGLAAFFVVFIHVSFPSPVGGIMNGVARFAVPLFFMSSGYFCYRKGADTLRRRIGNTWRLFLTANGVYFIWKLLMLAEGGMLSWQSLRELFSLPSLAQWIFLNQSPFMGHLWFLGALLYCYLLYAFLLSRKWEERLYILIPVCLLLNLALGEGASILGKSIDFLYVRNFWLTGLPFFLWGHWFHREQQRGCLRLGGRGSSFCAAAAVFGAGLSLLEMLLSGGAELYLGSLLTAGGLFLFAICNSGVGEGSALARIGERDALSIYLWQMLLYDAVQLCAGAIGIRDHVIYRWLLPLGICVLSWLLAEALQRIKKSREGREGKAKAVV